VQKKNYTLAPFIAAEWEVLRRYLKEAFMLTIFGYGAPQSDVEAITLLKEAWKSNRLHKLVETEIIDIKPVADLEKTWKGFVFSHHYEIHSDSYDSWLSKHPRRSCEALFNQNMEAKFIDDHPLPKKASFLELYTWLQPLFAVEAAAT
jgi:hypothetical protein